MALSCLLLASTSIWGQNAPLGKEVIRKFSERMAQNQTIHATFTFTLENLRENIRDSHQGSISLKGAKYILELMGMKVYFNGVTKWQFIPEANEVTISQPTSVEGGFFDDPTQIFRDYEKAFKSQFIGERVIGGKAIYEVDLYPEDISVPYSIIKIQFEKVTLNPVSIKYQGKDGNNYIIDIKTYRTNTPMSDQSFDFDPKAHRGIEIVDLR